MKASHVGLLLCVRSTREFPLFSVPPHVTIFRRQKKDLAVVFQIDTGCRRHLETRRLALTVIIPCFLRWQPST
jgi:hypothetical protein